MDIEPGRDDAVEVTKEREKFLVAMAWLTQLNHLPSRVSCAANRVLTPSR
jgi:hypothetical protein